MHHFPTLQGREAVDRTFKAILQDAVQALLNDFTAANQHHTVTTIANATAVSLRCIPRQHQVAYHNSVGAIRSYPAYETQNIAIRMYTKKKRCQPIPIMLSWSSYLPGCNCWGQPPTVLVLRLLGQ